MKKIILETNIVDIMQTIKIKLEENLIKVAQRK